MIRRYKRFLADIETEDGRTLTVHCPNPGAMTGTDRPGSRVLCSTSDDPKRKLRHTLEMIRVGRIYVGLHAARANALVARALVRDALPTLRGYAEHRAEIGVEHSRLDFLLKGHREDSRPAYVEVKSVTLAEGRTALFPDATTIRGRRHLEALMALKAQGARAVMVFVVQRADCHAAAPADHVDPAYGETLRAAAQQGVEILALGARVTGRGLRLSWELPFLL